MDSYFELQRYRRTLAVRATSVVATLALTITAGCTRDFSAPAGPSLATSTTSTGASHAMDAEEKRLDDVARVMALALSDVGLRQRLANDLRSSRHTRERKLPAQEYLRGTSGGILLAKMAQHSGILRDSLTTLLGAIRPLELYLPVQAHRDAWDGGSPLLVAAALTEEASPRAFDRDGKPVTLNMEVAPAMPTLVLTTRETDFSRTLAPGAAPGDVEARNELPDCYCPPPDTGSYTGPTYPAGRYMTFSEIWDFKEPWFRGEPEIEVHVHGPPDAANPQYGADLACASATAMWPRAFDQNSNVWTGRVLLFSAQQAAEYEARFSDGYNLVVWEDDDTPCVIKLDNTSFRDALRGIRDLFGVVALLPTKDPVKIGGAFIAALYQNASWLLTSDDYIGTAIPGELAPEVAQSSTHALMNSAFNPTGRISVYDF